MPTRHPFLGCQLSDTVGNSNYYLDFYSGFNPSKVTLTYACYHLHVKAGNFFSSTNTWSCDGKAARKDIGEPVYFVCRSEGPCGD